MEKMSILELEGDILFDRRTLTMNVLIMQSKLNRDEKDILSEKENIVKELEEVYGLTINPVDQHREDRNVLNQERHFNLILNMLNAGVSDLVAFGPNWKDSSECMVMDYFCRLYSINMYKCSS